VVYPKPRNAVVSDPAGILFGGRVPSGPTVMLRPSTALVHSAPKAHDVHEWAKLAVLEPSARCLIETVIPAGQVPMPSMRLIVKRSLPKSPLVAFGPWVLHFDSMPSASRRDWNEPVP